MATAERVEEGSARDSRISARVVAIRCWKFRDTVRAENWDIDVRTLSGGQLDALIEGKPLAQVLAMGNPAVERHG